MTSGIPAFWSSSRVSAATFLAASGGGYGFCDHGESKKSPLCTWSAYLPRGNWEPLLVIVQGILFYVKALVQRESVAQEKGEADNRYVIFAVNELK